MPDPPMTSVECLSVVAVEVMHSGREIGLRSLDEQMVVVGHLHPRVHQPSVAADHPRQDREEELPIDLVEEDVLTIDTSIGQMPDRSWELQTQRTRHVNARREGKRAVRRERKVWEGENSTTMDRQRRSGTVANNLGNFKTRPPNSPRRGPPILIR